MTLLSSSEMHMVNKSKNVKVEQLSGGHEVLRSYNVAVAMFIPGLGYVQSEQKYSVTTSKHVNQYTERCGTVVSREKFAQLLSEVL